MKMTMTEDEILGRIKMGVNVDIKRSDGKCLFDSYIDFIGFTTTPTRHQFKIQTVVAIV